jgi:hypothetical protein
MGSDFLKKLDDVVRQELTVMGRDYRELVRGIEDSGSAAVVRLHPPYEDVTFDEPEADLPDDLFAARVGRRLKVALDAPERMPGEEPAESV